MALSIAFITNARLPTEKAHGFAIMKTAESLASCGAQVTLVVPRRTSTASNTFPTSPFEHYQVKKNFTLLPIWTLDLYQVAWIPKGLAYVVQSVSFYISALYWYWHTAKGTIIYTRDYIGVLLAWFCDRVVYECHHLPHYKEAFFRMHRKNVRIVTISQGLFDEYISRGFERSRLLISPSGADKLTFDLPISQEEARAQLSLPTDKIILVYTGKFTTFGEDKGLKTVIEAMPHLRENYLFVAIGGEEVDIERCRTHAEGVFAQDKVLLLGRATQHTLALYQKAADILLLPFPNRGHFRAYMSPIKLFEYLFANRAILATDIPALSSMLSREQAAFVEADDPVAMAEAIKVLSLDPVRMSKLATNAYKLSGNYTWEARGKKIYDFLTMS